MNSNSITKSIITTAVISMLATSLSAQQLPSSFNYQAVVNADDGSPVAAKKITVEVSILQGTDCDKNNSCPVLWQELHYPTTSDFGLFSIEIGASSATNTYAGSCAQYSDINWLDVSQGYYYLKVRADFGESENLNSLSNLGTTMFSAVPYSLVAQKADFATSATSATTATTATTANEITADDNGKIANKLSQLADVDVSSAQANQVLTFDGEKWTSKTVTSSAQGASDLSGLSDVSVSSLANGNVLTYNSTNQKWENKPVPTPTSITKLSQLTDDISFTSSISSGDILSYNGTKWTNAKPAQWETTTHGIRYASGNVGIGNVTDPDNRLVIQDNSYKTSLDGNGITMKVGYVQMAGGTVTNQGNGSIASGSGCQVKNGPSIAIGEDNIVAETNSMAIGRGLTSSCPNSLVVGLYNATSDKLFVVGNGSGSSSKQDAFSVTADGVVSAAGNFYSNGNVLTTSDRRLKTNITPLEKSIDKVMKLNGVTFNWDRSVAKNANASTTLQYGFIAQELEKVIPELVSDGPDGYKTVNYIGVIPVLTQAMQEQQKEIEQLKEENQKLNNTLQELLKRVEALEKK